jgi:molecular chaperone DnaK
VKDAEAHASEDKDRRDLIDVRNQADSLAYSVEKTINDNRDRLPATDVSRVESAIAAVRDALKTDNVSDIRRTTDELQKASHAIAEQLYKQQASGPGPQASEQTDDIRDGEVVDA